eukprot:6458223-Alexandrium_andersonii.AAC.1
MSASLVGSEMCIRDRNSCDGADNRRSERSMYWDLLTVPWMPLNAPVTSKRMTKGGSPPSSPVTSL